MSSLEGLVSRLYGAWENLRAVPGMFIKAEEYPQVLVEDAIGLILGDKAST